MTVRLPARAGDAPSVGLTDKQVSNALANSLLALLELFSVVDDVFTEDDAFDRARLSTGLGRIYRAWKNTRKELGGE
jgi:hypothetical protein